MVTIFDDKIDFMKDILHVPVLLNDVLKYLIPTAGETYIDCTFGAGGYSRAILASANCQVIGVDQDPDVIVHAEKLHSEYSNFTFWQSNFGNISEKMQQHNITQVDGVIVDLGVSSMQIDNGERGFSFMHDGPLDMRMNKFGMSAAEYINKAEEAELADIIYNYGDENDARKIARHIVHERQINPITTTGVLANVVRKAIGFRKSKIDLATKTFQAIRIHINDELGMLKRLLEQTKTILKPHGRLIVVSFHSLEDRIVKQFLRSNSPKKIALSKYANLQERYDSEATFNLLTRKSIKPSVQETIYNSRSRSAKLRAAVKIDHHAQ